MVKLLARTVGADVVCEKPDRIADFELLVLALRVGEDLVTFLREGKRLLELVDVVSKAGRPIVERDGSVGFLWSSNRVGSWMKTGVGEERGDAD